ncbi:MAG: hypothetical protein WCL13_01790 [bacterium]
MLKTNNSLAADSPVFYHNIALNPGWNIVSTPRLVLNSQFSVATTSANFDIYVLNSSNASGWSTMQEISQTEFTPLYGYFINNKTGAEQTLTLNYKESVEPDERLFNRQLSQGWNVIGVANPTYALKQKDSNSSDNNNITSILASLSGCSVSVLDFTADQADKYSVKVGDAWSQKTWADANQLNDFRETKAYAVYLNSSCNYQGFQNNDEISNVWPLGSLAITKAATSPTTDVSVDSADVTLGIFDFTASDEDIKINNLNVQADITGGANGGILNGKVYIDDVQIGSTKNLDEATSTIFTFGSTFIVEAGTTVKVKIVGDIKTTTSTSYVGNETVKISLNTGASNAQRMTSSGTFNTPASSISANTLNIAVITLGSLSISRSAAAPTGNITVDGTSVIVGEWDFRAAGEDMKVKDLAITATTVSTRMGGLDNGKVYVDGAQVGSTKDLTEGAGITNWGFGSSFIVKAGTTAKVKVVADIKTSTSTSYANGNTVQVSITSGASDIQRVSSLTYQAGIGPIPGTAAVLTMSAAGMLVSKYSGYGNQTIVAGTNDVKLGAFVISAGSAEGVSVSSITVTFVGGTNNASITNMYLKDTAGVIIGTAKNVPGTSNIYSLSPNIALAANGSKSIELYANVKSAADAGALTAIINASGSGAVTGGSVASVAADQQLQTMTIASSGTLTVANGSMPDRAIILAGSTSNYVAEYQFSAANEGFTVSELKLKVSNNFATSTSAVNLVYTDKAGTTVTSPAGMFITGAEADATATFTGLTMYVPANADATLKVYVSLTSIASGAASGANSLVGLDYNEGFKATGDSGTPILTPTGSLGDFVSNSFYVRKSKPTFAKLDAGTDPVNGALYKFSVVADNAGNIDIKQLGFTVSTTACEVTDLYLYDSNTSTILTDLAYPVTAVQGAAVAVLVGAIDADVLSIGTTVKTYELRGTVTGYGQTNDNIIVRFKQDVTPVANGTALAKGADGVDAGGGDKYNVWSDRSASGHTTSSSDWTNGYLLKDMTSSQSFSR